MNQLLSQTFNYGNIINLIETGLISSTDILEYIINHTDKNDTRFFIAYSLLCQNENPMAHYINGFHFLYYVNSIPEYSVIYVVRGGKMELPISTIEDRGSVSSLIGISIINFHTNAEFRKKMSIILNLEILNHMSSFKEPDIHLALMANYNNLNSLMIKSNIRKTEYQKMVINIDNFSLMQNIKSDNLIKYVCNRCKYLLQNANLYFEIIKPKYSEIISLALKKEQELNKELVSFLVENFKDLVNSEITNFSDLALKIYNYPLILQAYLLGFDIYSAMPTKEMIIDSLNLLSSEGEEKYIQRINNYNKKRLKLIMPNGKIYELEKNTDVLENNIYDYNIIDLIGYIDNKHYYVFSRPEFQNLLQTKKHLYTQTQIPDMILSMIMLKIQQASNNNLPVCNTIPEYYNMIKNNTEINNATTNNTYENLLYRFTPMELFSSILGVN
jgi:hypothetical protein